MLVDVVEEKAHSVGYVFVNIVKGIIVVVIAVSLPNVNECLT